MLNDIKSNEILKLIFQKMKNKRKLKVIKRNKKIINRLNVTKDDFKAYETLKQLTKKFELKINDIDIDCLQLINKGVKNEDLEYLKIFKELKVLNISWNKISNIDIFEKLNLKKLNKLILSDNKISDINI